MRNWGQTPISFWAPLAALAGAVLAGLSWLNRLPPEQAARIAGLVGSLFIFGVVVAFLLAGMWRRVNVYDAFIDGAKEGFGVAVQIVPYLIAVLVAVGLFRAAGCMDYVLCALGAAVAALGLDTAFLPALPVGLMKVLSGAGRPRPDVVCRVFDAAPAASGVQRALEVTLHGSGISPAAAGRNAAPRAEACPGTSCATPARNWPASSRMSWPGWPDCGA